MSDGEWPATELDQIEEQHRRTQAYELRLAGATYPVIADRLGFATPEDAQASVIQELRRQSAHDNTATDLELARLDAMLLGLWAKARRGDRFAVEQVLKISERRIVLLGGAPAPAITDDDQETGLDEFTRRLRERKTTTAHTDASG
jgi:hypothetical protein